LLGGIVTENELGILRLYVPDDAVATVCEKVWALLNLVVISWDWLLETPVAVLVRVPPDILPVTVIELSLFIVH
jgi:hypothetical protein